MASFSPPPYYVGNEAVLTTTMNTNSTNHKHQQIHILINIANILYVINKHISINKYTDKQVRKQKYIYLSIYQSICMCMYMQLYVFT